MAHFALDNYHTIISDCMEIHFLELPKLKISDIKNMKKLDTWGAYFLGKCNKKEMEELIMTNPVIKDAVSYEDYFTGDDEKRIQYRKREEAILDEKFRNYAATQYGIQKEKIQNAINFLKLGVDIETISKGTGLSEQEVFKLQQSLIK